MKKVSSVAALAVSVILLGCPESPLPGTGGGSGSTGGGAATGGGSAAGGGSGGGSQAGGGGGSETGGGGGETGGGAGGGSATGGGAGGGSATGGGGGSSSSAPSGRLLMSVMGASAGSMTPASLELATIVDGVASTPVPLTQGNFSDVFPAFSVDGGQVVFIRNELGTRSDPTSVQVINLDGTGLRELVRCPPGSVGGFNCREPVVGDNDSVYYVESEDMGADAGARVMRVPLAGGTPELFQAFSPACTVHLNQGRDRATMMISVSGPDCDTSDRRDFVIEVATASSQTIERMGFSGVNFVEPAQFAHATASYALIGQHETTMVFGLYGFGNQGTLTELTTFPSAPMDFIPLLGAQPLQPTRQQGVWMTGKYWFRQDPQGLATTPQPLSGLGTRVLSSFDWLD